MSRRVIQSAPHRIRVVLDKNPSQTKPSFFESFRHLSVQNASGVDEGRRLLKVVRQLDRLVGLKNVKELVYEVYALLHINQCRERMGLKGDEQVLHMIFKGKPGTGKTTVARIIGELLREMHVLDQGHLIEVERADLVGEYIGHTAQKTREHVKKALGGILFIDEAYALARGGEKDFGKEAIDTLVKAMEDHKNDFILILAGYSQEMDSFLNANPGLPSRFPIQIDFPDYTVEQLMDIAGQMFQEREYEMTEQAKKKLKHHLEIEMNNPFCTFSNARYVRNMIEQSIRHQAVRLAQQTELTKKELMQVQSDDLRLVDEER